MSGSNYNDRSSVSGTGYRRTPSPKVGGARGSDTYSANPWGIVTGTTGQDLFRRATQVQQELSHARNARIVQTFQFLPNLNPDAARAAMTGPVQCRNLALQPLSLPVFEQAPPNSRERFGRAPEHQLQGHPFGQSAGPFGLQRSPSFGQQRDVAEGPAGNVSNSRNSHQRSDRPRQRHDTIPASGSGIGASRPASGNRNRNDKHAGVQKTKGPAQSKR